MRFGPSHSPSRVPRHLNQALEERSQVADNIQVGVLLDRQRRGRMADIHGQQAGSNTEPVPRRSAGRTRPAAGWRGCADRRAGGQGLAAVDLRHGNRRRQARPRRADSFPVPEERSQSVRIPADRRPGQAAGRLVPQAAIQVRDRDLRQAALLTAVPPQELGDTGCIGCHGACGQAPLLPQTGREDRQPVRVRHRGGGPGWPSGPRSAASSPCSAPARARRPRSGGRAIAPVTYGGQSRAAPGRWVAINRRVDRASPRPAQCSR